MRERTKKKKKFGIILLLIYIVFMLSVILTNGLSKFKTTHSTNAKARIANPIVNVVTETLEVSDLHNEEYELNFSVNNYDDTNKVNQVLLEYTIQINTGNLSNVEYELYKINGSEKTKVELLNGITQQGYELISDTIQEDEYCLVIKTSNTVPEEFIKDNVIVSVSATQKVS